MHRKSFIILSLCFILGFLNACSDSNYESKEEIIDVIEVINTNFPNKRSELSMLMRTLYNDTKAEKKLLINKEHSSVDWISKYGNLLTAKQTDDSNNGEVFDNFGNSFLSLLKAYQNTTKNNRISNYNLLITTCMNCHQAYCIGPILVIKKLPITNKK
jgi:hypothetical protein|tara:strand:- start:84 stop:557 length:474 start_codon:yes stop_codon:yes gene_type:complete